MIKNSTILLIIVLVFSACDDDDVIIDDKITHVTPTFITELFPADNLGIGANISKNVIQGLAAFENGWFTTQKTTGGLFLINYLAADGVSLFHYEINYKAHGQDLSIDQVSENQLFLYTTKGDFEDIRNTGLTKFIVDLAPLVNGERDWSATVITLDAQHNLDYSHSTPTLNEEKNKFAIRSSNTILVHDRAVLEIQNYTPLYRFELHSDQLVDNSGKSMFFQGIAMKNDEVFCLTGNDEYGTEKKIFIYDKIGLVQKRLVFDRNDLGGQTMIDKVEPEGLTFINNELYFTIMTKPADLDGNRKYVYKIDI